MVSAAFWVRIGTRRRDDLLGAGAPGYVYDVHATPALEQTWGAKQLGFRCRQEVNGTLVAAQ